MPDKLDNNHDAIPFKDLIMLIKSGKFWIIFSMIIGIFAMVSFGLSRPIRYPAHATFKDKGNTRDPFSSTAITSLLTSGISNKYKSDAKTLMTSRKLLERVVHQLGLQVHVHELSKDVHIGQTLADNLAVEYFYLRNIQNYPLKDHESKISVTSTVYHQDIPRTLKLAFEGKSLFYIFDMKTEENLGKGIPGIPYKGKNFEFLVNTHTSSLENETFILTLLPIEKVVENLRSRLEILPDSDDESLLTLEFFDRNRQLSALFLNTLMQVYQDYQREEKNRLSSEQIAYLNRREEEMGENLEKVLTAYADQLSAEVNDIGYIESKKGMEFLTKEMQFLRQKYMSAKLDLQRLEELDSDHFFYQATEHPQLFNDFITKIKELDIQTDQIEIALRNSDSKNITEWQKSFTKQLQDLNGMRRCAEDAQVILASLENEKYPLPVVSLMEHPQYMVNSWNLELNRCLQRLENARPWEKDSRKEDLQQYRQQFIGYLNHLQHFLDVNQKMVKERLEHQQAPQFEFQGINLNSASELYITYSKQLSVIENQILQYRFMIEQLDKPYFELSSFSSVVDEDPIALELMKKASEYAVGIQDDSNRGIKEKERFKTELDTLKKFYTLHLNQTMELTKLKELLLKGKIESLQNAVLELIQQQRSILENQFMEAVESQTQRLKQEKGLIEQQMIVIREELKKLPQKWASEKFVEHQINLNARMVEELTKLVESKNISYNLEMIQSSPLDLAIPPIKPKRPHLLLYATLGAFFGFFLSCGCIMLKTMINGFPISKENLEFSGLRVRGYLSKTDETQKSVTAFVLNSQQKQCAIIGNSSLSLAKKIASRLCEQDQNVLLMEIRSDKNFEKTEASDHIFIHEFSAEAYNLSKELEKYHNQYDYVIITSAAQPISPIAESILNQVDTAIILLTNETKMQIHPLIQRAKHQNLSFILP